MGGGPIISIIPLKPRIRLMKQIAIFCFQVIAPDSICDQRRLRASQPARGVSIGHVAVAVNHEQVVRDVTENLVECTLCYESPTDEICIPAEHEMVNAARGRRAHVWKRQEQQLLTLVSANLGFGGE